MAKEGAGRGRSGQFAYLELVLEPSHQPILLFVSLACLVELSAQSTSLILEPIQLRHRRRGQRVQIGPVEFRLLQPIPPEPE